MTMVGDKKRIKQVFDEFDTDHDGQLDRAEIRAGLARLLLPVSADHVDHVLNTCDRDGDGLVSLREFEAFVATRARELQEAYDGIRSGNAEITKMDLNKAIASLHLKVSDASIQKLIQRADTDKNGAISFEEFHNFLLFAPGQLPLHIFNYWAHSSAIDIGESMAVPDNFPTYKSAGITLASGAVAGAVSRTTTAPMDRLKVMLQAGSGSTGITQGLRSIYQEGGWRAFWRGNGANVLKIAPETAVKFLCYDSLKQQICRDPTEPSMAERLATGAIAGAVSQASIYPLEVAKTRLAVSPPGTYRGIGDCVVKLTAQGGVGSLYRGLNASLLGIMPYAGVDLALYTWLKDRWLKAHPDCEDGPSVTTLLAYGAMSSTAGQVVAYPLQLVRTKLQAQGMPGVERYNGTYDCFRKVVQRDGPLGLYRGLGPNFIKTLPAIAISYATFESTKKVLSNRASSYDD